MVCTMTNTVIEIWAAPYISNPSGRLKKDQDTRIIQIEHSEGIIIW